MMTEAVRLVIWDLDETFWYGTLTEGGITIRPETCALVQTLARRGIMSSICSKNNLEDVKSILKENEVWDYFVFPSVNWETKGPRVASIVEAMQLRPSTVMFIDDNPMNLAEVADAVPGIQVQSHEFIEQIEDSALFSGKDDAILSRLQQYKILETKKQDELAASGDNSEFLRKSDICVMIDHDIDSQIDRAIELINRTNQLNYTKRRLPEDPEKAREQLKRELKVDGAVSGLVRVRDRYGDYGFVGFYLAEFNRADPTIGDSLHTLKYYCFSCRTLGMYVEKWLYEHLRRPSLTTVGEVLTDLSEKRNVDWIKLVLSMEDDGRAFDHIAPEIRVHGGCEAHSIAHYLDSYSDKVSVTGNLISSGMIVQFNSVACLLSASERINPTFEAEASKLAMPYAELAFDFFGDAPEGTLFIFGGGYDESPGNNHYRHKQHGWRLKIGPSQLHTLDFVKHSEEEILEKVHKRGFCPEDEASIIRISKHIRQNYESCGRGLIASVIVLMRQMFDRVPAGSKLIVVLNAQAVPGKNGMDNRQWVIDYNRIMTELTNEYEYVSTVCFDDYIYRDEENHGWGHYDRMVYSRLVDGIKSVAAEMPPKRLTT